MHDEVDVKAAEHVAGLHMTCTYHPGRRFAGERPRGDESPEQSICSPRRSAAAVPLWPLRSETPEGVEDERERISKIRARPPLRLRAVHTTGAADGAESATREREVAGRKVGHIPRHPPVVGIIDQNENRCDFIQTHVIHVDAQSGSHAGARATSVRTCTSLDGRVSR